MRRQRRPHHFTDDDDYRPASSAYQPLLNDAADFLQMERLAQDGETRKQLQYRFENTIEAKVEDGDTLQALALRFHCTVADIKRLNKIDKDNEIHAHKVIKIPVTVHSVLLGALPQVHKSGNNSPRDSLKDERFTDEDETALSHIMRNPLEDARVMLNEKLMIASVNAAGAEVASSSATASNINNIILNSKATGNATIYTDDDSQRQFRSLHTGDAVNDGTSPLLAEMLDDEILPHVRRIRGPSMRTIDWSGSDCDMSWVCLFVVILALCVIIPLVSVIYFTERAHHHNATAH